MANSTSDAVGATVAAAVTALAIPGPNGPMPVVRRKTPSVPDGATGGLPQIVISVGEEGKTEYLTALTKLKTYPVAVTVVSAGGQALADDPQVRQWRQQIELALEGRAAWQSLAGWSRVTITNRPPFDVSALAKDYNYATVVAEVEVVEVRGT